MFHGETLPLVRLTPKLPTFYATRCNSRHITISFADVQMQPVYQERKEGSRVKFRCRYHGNEKVRYYWLKDGTTIYGQNSSTLVLNCVELRDFGYYECRVSFAKSDYIVSSYGELDVVPRDGMGECCD